MRAVGIHAFGGPSQLELLDLPVPKIPPDAVRIRIHAAGVNPVDRKLCEGRLEPRFPHTFPVVPGWDAAGTVDEVGPSVTEFAPGDEVLAYCRKHFVGEGTYAEFVSVPAGFVASKPSALSFREAAALPLAGLTAYQALFFVAGLTAGETVLVYGASGGVGGLATQLASDAGADVIGVAREDNRGYVLANGAYGVVDHTAATDLAEQVRALVPEGVDVVLDVIGGTTLERSVAAVRDGGRIVSIAHPPSGDAFRERGIVPSYWFVRPDGEQLDELARLAAEGRLRIDVSEQFPLERASDAHERLQAGRVRGKLVLDVLNG